jgi:hypothetical protein
VSRAGLEPAWPIELSQGLDSNDAQEFLVAPTRRFLFEALEFEKALLKGRCEQIVNRDVFSRRNIRCSSPKVTTCSTASNTLSHEVRNASAVSFHESRRAQRARNNMYARVRVRLPSPHGTHRVKQKNQKSPERNKFETALGELIVSGGGLMATGTNRCRTLARTHRDLNPFVIGAEARLLVNESRKTVTTI